MHLEAHIDTVFAWRPLPVVDEDNCSRGRRVWWRRVWRNRTLWVGDTPCFWSRAVLTNGYILSADTVSYKEMDCNPRIPGTATVAIFHPWKQKRVKGKEADSMVPQCSQRRL